MGTFERGEENAAKRVTHRLAETRFQWLELESALEIGCFLQQDFVRLLEIENAHIERSESDWVVKNKFVFRQGTKKPGEGFGILCEKG